MCRSPFQLSISRMRGVCGLAIDRAPHNGHAATAAAHVRVRLAAYVRTQPPSVQNASGSRAHEPLHDTTAHGRPQRLRPQNRRSDSSMDSQAATATTAAITPTVANVPKSCPRCKQPPTSCTTICSQSSQTLPPSTDERMSASAAVTGRVRDQRDAHQRSSQGGWRPADIVRATSGRACRFDAPIGADLLGALRAGTGWASTLQAFRTGF